MVGYRIETQHLQDLLAVLQERYEAARIGPWHRVAFIMLQIFAYAVPIAALIAILEYQEIKALEGYSCLVLQALIALGLGLLVLVPLNLPVLIPLVRQIRLFNELGLLVPDRVAEYEWREPRRRVTWFRLLGAAFLLFVLAAAFLHAQSDVYHLMLLTLETLLLGGAAFFIATGRRLSMRTLHVSFWVLVGIVLAAGVAALVLPDDFGLLGALTVVVVIGVPGLTLLANRFLARAEERFKIFRDFEELHGSLQERTAAAAVAEEDWVDMTYAQASRLSNMERAMLEMQRTKAIARAHRHGALGYGVFQSARVRQRLTGLGAVARLAVEDAIQDLSDEPRPEAAREVDGNYHLGIPAAGLELVYEIAADAQQVRVLDALELEGAADG